MSVGSSTEASGSSASATTASDSSTGAAVECPDNVALEPFCYRKVPIAWDGELATWWHGPSTARVGNFGPDGEEAFLLSEWDAGTPMALAFWNGAAFDVQPWGVMPELDRAGGRIPIRFFDGVHSDLLVGAGGPDPVIAVAPWTPDGPGEPLTAALPSSGHVISVFDQQPVLDVDGDGLEEFAVFYDDEVLYNGFEHYLVGNADGVPQFFGPLITHDGGCGEAGAQLGLGHFDGDAFLDLAALGWCDVMNLDGEFAFAAEWGDGTGAFASVGKPFTGTSSASWLGAGDFDDDGLDDVVIAMASTGTYQGYIEVHRSHGDRTFAPAEEVWREGSRPEDYLPTRNGAVPNDSHFIVGDIDNDGTDDLIFRRSLTTIVDVLGERSALTMFDIPWSQSVEVVSPFDFNHDGRLDFIVRDDSEGIYALISS